MIMIVKTFGSQMSSPAAAEEGPEDEVPRISLRVSSKLPSSPSLLLSSVITALARTSAYLGTTAAFAQTLASSLTSSKSEEGRRAEGLEGTQ